MKRCIAIILIFVFILTGCSTSTNTSINTNTVKISKDYNENATDYTFTRISSGSRMTIYKEDITDVMYVAYHAGFKGGLTVMLDTDGTPLLYSEWKNKLN